MTHVRCCCDDPTCLLVLLPCGCDCPLTLGLMPLTPDADANWPADQREIGSVIETRTLGCWRLMGSTDEPIAGTHIDASQIVAVHENCDAVECEGGDCDDDDRGDVYTIQNGAPCLESMIQTRCIKRVVVGWYASGYRRLNEERTGEDYSEWSYAVASGTYELTDSDPDLHPPGFAQTDWEFETLLIGGDSDGDSWNIQQQFTDTSVGWSGNGPQPESASYSFNFPFQPVSGQVPISSFAPLDPDYPIDLDEPCNETIEWDDFDDGGSRGEVTHRGTMMHNRSTSEVAIRVEYPESPSPLKTVVSASLIVRIRILELELVDDTVLTFDECDEPAPSIAVACDPESVPDEITYDVRLIPRWVTTIIDPTTGIRYVPTSTPSEESPTGFVPDIDGCEDPPDPTGDVYKIYRCGTSTHIEYTLSNGPPSDPSSIVAQTIGYIPGDGLLPGQGRVGYTSLGAGNCLYSFQGQPSTEVLTEAPDVIVTSLPGTCAGWPAAISDTRSQCQPSGNVDPTPSPTLNAGGEWSQANGLPLGDITEKIINTVTLGKVKPCSGCKKRKAALNDLGARIVRVAKKGESNGKSVRSR